MEEHIYRPKTFLSTEEILPPYEFKQEKQKASESLLKAFINAKPQSDRQNLEDAMSIYRDVSLSNVNVKQMLAILFQKCEDVMKQSDLFTMNNLSGSRVFFDCLVFL